MKAAIVVTSIHDCTDLLDGYLKNFSKFGRDAVIYLIPDIKTPKFSVPDSVYVPDSEQQVHFLESIGFDPADIPWNSDNRRNVGYLMALADGAEMIVSIDDDNYCPENQDFIENHGHVFADSKLCVSRKSGWYNNLMLYPRSDIFPRGFPYYAKSPFEQSDLKVEVHPIRINAGMWIGDPDLDALTWLHTASFSPQTCAGSIILSSDTWCPINSQNTAVHRDLMPAYYFIRMVPPSDRFGDIFQGYFALKVAKHMGWTARFGSPVVLHKRNSHVYLKDVEKEIGPILLLEELLPKLIEHKLTGTTPTEAYLSLAD